MKGDILHMTTRTQGGDNCQKRKVTMQMQKVCLHILKLNPFGLWFTFFFKQKRLSCLSAEADTEWHRSPDLQDFLLQSSDEEDVCSLELSDPQLDLEADVMAYFDKNPRNNARQQREKLSK